MMKAMEAIEGHELARRVARMEQENRRLRLAPGHPRLPVTMLILMGAARHERTVQASQFVLVDESGSTRAVLGMRSAGPPLAFYDQNGKNVEAMLGILHTGPALGFYGQDETLRTLLGTKGQSATLSFNDDQGKMRAEPGWAPNTAHLLFFDENQKEVYQVP